MVLEVDKIHLETSASDDGLFFRKFVKNVLRVDATVFDVDRSVDVYGEKENDVNDFIEPVIEILP
jgi:hypothetical protein